MLKILQARLQQYLNCELPDVQAGLRKGPFTPRSGLQEIPVAIRQESGVLFFPSRRGLTLRVSRECNPEIPVGPVVDPETPPKDSVQAWRAAEKGKAIQIG